MPEGGSLHRAARQLTPVLLGKKVSRFELVRRAERTDAVVGQLVEGVEARGKNLLVHFAGGVSLHVHLKMLGRISISPMSAPHRDQREGAVVVLETDAHRVLVSRAPVARLIRTRDLVRDLHFRDLGPDLLSDTFQLDEALRRLTMRKEQPLGIALMDQSAVAGIGNVWKSELCFNTHLDPFAPVAAFRDQELTALLQLAQKQMRENVERKPRTIPDPFAPRHRSRHARIDHRLGQKPLSVYRREGLACYDCGTLVQMQRQGNDARSTYYCGKCQPARSAP